MPILFKQVFAVDNSPCFIGWVQVYGVLQGEALEQAKNQAWGAVPWEALSWEAPQRR
jgi:hypothetical protein